MSPLRKKKIHREDAKCAEKTRRSPEEKSVLVRVYQCSFVAKKAFIAGAAL